jgi:hypothetical protein
MRIDDMAIVELLIAFVVAVGTGGPQNMSQNSEGAETHFVSCIGSDTVLFADAAENLALKKEIGQGFAFFRKRGGEVTQLFALSAIDAFRIDYYIDDFDFDGINEVLIVASDEAFFGVTIYSVYRSKDTLAVRTLFQKDGMATASNFLVGSDFPFVALKQANGKIDHIVINTCDKHNRHVSYLLRYDNKTKRFRLH